MKNFSAAPRWLFILSLCLVGVLSIASPVFAVRLAPGSVPQTKPLQPIPEGIQPNLEENVQSRNVFPDAASESELTDGKNSLPNLSVGQDAASVEPGEVADEGKGSARDIWVFVIILIVAMGGGSFVYMRVRGGA